MINIIYWTLSGNTQMMAEAIGEGVKESGKEVNVTNVNSIIADDLKDEQVFALGASAMGDEELDPEMDDFVSEIEKDCKGKAIALFGSYDWGNGKWMADLENRLKDHGAIILNDKGYITRLSPDDKATCDLKQIGSQLANI